MTGRPMVELHFKACRCQGAGVLFFPSGIIRECRHPRPEAVLVSYEAWTEAGRPRTADDFEAAVRRAKLETLGPGD